MWLLVCSDSEIADFISDNAEQHLQQGFPLIFRGEVMINYAIFFCLVFMLKTNSQSSYTYNLRHLTGTYYPNSCLFLFLHSTSLVFY